MTKTFLDFGLILTPTCISGLTLTSSIFTAMQFTLLNTESRISVSKLLWNQLSVAIAGAISGSPFLALYFTPAAYLMMHRHTHSQEVSEGKQEIEALPAVQ